MCCSRRCWIVRSLPFILSHSCLTGIAINFILIGAWAVFIVDETKQLTIRFLLFGIQCSHSSSSGFSVEWHACVRQLVAIRKCVIPRKRKMRRADINYTMNYIKCFIRVIFFSCADFAHTLKTDAGQRHIGHVACTSAAAVAELSFVSIFGVTLATMVRHKAKHTLQWFQCGNGWKELMNESIDRHSSSHVI